MLTSSLSLTSIKQSPRKFQAGFKCLQQSHCKCECKYKGAGEWVGLSDLAMVVGDAAPGQKCTGGACAGGWHWQYWESTIATLQLLMLLPVPTFTLTWRWPSDQLNSYMHECWRTGRDGRERREAREWWEVDSDGIGIKVVVTIMWVVIVLVVKNVNILKIIKRKKSYMAVVVLCTDLLELRLKVFSWSLSSLSKTESWCWRYHWVRLQLGLITCHHHRETGVDMSVGAVVVTLDVARRAHCWGKLGLEGVHYHHPLSWLGTGVEVVIRLY